MNPSEVISFNLTDAGLAELAEKYLPLTVKDPDDKAGYAAAREARLDVKARRVAVEKTRVELKAGALEYGRKVDAEAKRITAKLTAIESHLEAQEAIVINEIERRKKLEEEKKAAVLQARFKALEECQKRDYVAAHVAAMSDQQFATFLEQAQAAHAQRMKEEADAAAARKAEAKKLADERAELDKARKAQEEEARKVREEQAAQQRKLDEERRQIELAKARQEAAEKAQRDAEAKIERERLEAQRKAEAEEAACQQALARRPDRMKLLAVAEALDAITVPKVSDEAAGLAADIANRIDDLAGDIRTLVDKFAAEVDERAIKTA